MPCRLPMRLPLFLALALPAAAHAGHRTPPHVVTVPAGSEALQACDGLASLPDKRACYGRQDQTTIDACERIHPMRCRPYGEMDSAERRLAEAETASLAAAEQAYARYVEGDAAYLTDLAAAATAANRAWRAYREAQCALEPFAQGMSRNGSEDLIEACRLDMTQARIDALKTL